MHTGYRNAAKDNLTLGYYFAPDFSLWTFPPDFRLLPAPVLEVRGKVLDQRGRVCTDRKGMMISTSDDDALILLVKQEVE